jgi:hypothetical protein
MKKEDLTEESAIKEAKRWYCRSSFKTHSPLTYNYCRKNNLLDSFEWMDSERIINDISIEQAFEEASKYEYFVDFEVNSNKEYLYARERGILHTYDWLKLSEKHSNLKKTCFEVSKNYDSLIEFCKKENRYYDSAVRFGWLEEMSWLKRIKDRYITDEVCYSVAKNYEYLYDFKKKSKSYYNYAKKNNILHKFIWLKDGRRPSEIGKERIWCVYCYKFTDLNYVYVGLTRDLNKRVKWHIKGSSRPSAIYRFAKENQIVLKEENFIVLENKLNSEEAQYFENFYVEKFKDDGWDVLNKAKTGIGVGSIGGEFKWDKQSCLEVAKTVSCSTEMIRKYPAAYQSANKYGWTKDYTWFKNPQIKEVVQYSLDGKMVNVYYSAREASRSVGISRSGIIGACRGHCKTLGGYLWRFKEDVVDGDSKVLEKIDPCLKTPPGKRSWKWDRDSCYKEALKYDSMKKFKRDNRKAYLAALNYGYTYEYDWMKKDVILGNSNKPVVQYDLEGNYINEYETTEEAALKEENTRTNILWCCRGHIKTTKCKIWRFKSDVLDEKGEVLKKIEIDSGEKS